MTLTAYQLENEVDMRKILTLIILILAASIAAQDSPPEYTRLDVPSESDITKIFFINDFYGYAVTAGGELLSTSNGGKIWRSKDVTKREITDICFSDRTGFLCGDMGMIMKTTNGGTSWTDMSQNLKYRFTGIAMLDDSTVFVVGTDQNSMAKTRGVIFASYNYGNTWDKFDKHLGNGYTDIVTDPPRKVYILAIKRAYHSISSGKHFFHGAYGGGRLGFCFDFIEDWGFMVGNDGLFSRTTTHGREWEDVDVGLTKNLYSVAMFDKYSGIAVGEDGVVLYFSESGDKYRSESCGYDFDLNTVFLTDTKIFIGGDEGLMLVKDR